MTNTIKTNDDLVKAPLKATVNADETDDEAGVVAEVNACRDLIGNEGGNR